jgi:hypothetical protein
MKRHERSEHYTKATETVSRFCRKEGRDTEWTVSAGKLDHCKSCAALRHADELIARKKRGEHIPTIYESLRPPVASQPAPVQQPDAPSRAAPLPLFDGDAAPGARRVRR